MCTRQYGIAQTEPQKPAEKNHKTASKQAANMTSGEQAPSGENSAAASSHHITSAASFSESIFGEGEAAHVGDKFQGNRFDSTTTEKEAINYQHI